MPAGIEIYDANGNLQFDISTRLFRVLVPNQVMAYGGGSVSVPNQGTVAVIAQGGEDARGDAVVVTVSGTTVSWSAAETSLDAAILVY